MYITSGRVRCSSGREGELAVAAKLRTVGFKNVLVPLHRACDLIVDGVRVEVKSANPNKSGRWTMLLTPHANEFEENGTDVYVFYLRKVPAFQMNAVFLVFRAPLKVRAMTFSVSTLLSKFHDAIDNWDLIRQVGLEIEAGLLPIPPHPDGPIRRVRRVEACELGCFATLTCGHVHMWRYMPVPVRRKDGSPSEPGRLGAYVRCKECGPAPAPPNARHGAPVPFTLTSPDTHGR
jgi:hypothetical protein